MSDYPVIRIPIPEFNRLLERFDGPTLEFFTALKALCELRGLDLYKYDSYGDIRKDEQGLPKTVPFKAWFEDGHYCCQNFVPPLVRTDSRSARYE